VGWWAGQLPVSIIRDQDVIQGCGSSDGKGRNRHPWFSKSDLLEGKFPLKCEYMKNVFHFALPGYFSRSGGNQGRSSSSEAAITK
jgi:hypothetical protein